MTKNNLKKADKSPRVKLYGRIHGLMIERGISDETYRDILFVNFAGAESKTDLTEYQLRQLIKHLEALPDPRSQVPSPGRYPGRPHNMDRTGSRAAQIEKIEALLTIGKLPWSYADAIAKQMRLADKLAWVREADLYKIITALRKKAQKEGWDLSGEQR